MHRFPIGRTLGVACVLVATLATLSSGRASAQDAPNAQRPEGSLGPGPQEPQGPMTVERVRGGWTIAPDFKVTHFDGGTRTLAGAYGGWVLDNTLMIGGAGYTLTDPTRTRRLSYGGAVVEWRQ